MFLIKRKNLSPAGLFNLQNLSFHKFKKSLNLLISFKTFDRKKIQSIVKRWLIFRCPL